MRSRWRELDTPIRVSAIVGYLGGGILFFLVAPLVATLEQAGFGLGQSTGSSQGDYFLIIGVALSPFFLIAGALLLTLVPLSQEKRGILGFLLLVTGIIPLLFVLPYFLYFLFPSLFPIHS